MVVSESHWTIVGGHHGYRITLPQRGEVIRCKGHGVGVSDVVPPDVVYALDPLHDVFGLYGQHVVPAAWQVIGQNYRHRTERGAARGAGLNRVLRASPDKDHGKEPDSDRRSPHRMTRRNSHRNSSVVVTIHRECHGRGNLGLSGDTRELFLSVIAARELLLTAMIHAELWSDLASRCEPMGAHDLCCHLAPV